MRKIVLFLSLITYTTSFSQEKEVETFKKNELKLNAVYLLGGALDVTYERILTPESGVGGTMFISFNNELTQEFSLTGFYRFYFGKKIASGFFIEGFGALNQFDNSDDYYERYELNGNWETIYDENYSKVVITDFALGFAGGSKWVTKKGLIFELYVGAGRNLFNAKSEDYDAEIIPRAGFNIGFRY